MQNDANKGQIENEGESKDQEHDSWRCTKEWKLKAVVAGRPGSGLILFDSPHRRASSPFSEGVDAQPIPFPVRIHRCPCQLFQAARHAFPQTHAHQQQARVAEMRLYPTGLTSGVQWMSPGASLKFLGFLTLE